MFKTEDLKMTKNKLKQKRKTAISVKGKMKIPQFSILSYTQNRKLGNLAKFSVISNFDSSCNLRWKNGKKLTEARI